MSERHTLSFEEFDLVVDVSPEGNVFIKFRSPASGLELDMTWDDLREAVAFAAVHGLQMHEPYVVEFAETVEGAKAHV